MDPWLAFVMLALVLEMLVITGDRLAGVLLLTGLAPFLLAYAKWNPGFIWAAAGIAVMALLRFYPEVWQRIRGLRKTERC